MTARIPPPIQEPFVDTRTGLIRRVWYDFLQNRDTATGLIDSLTTAKIWIGSAVNLPAEKSVSGDATLATNGALTLATVNTDTGTFGSSTVVGQFTVGGKGLITAASSVPIVLTSSAITDFTEAAQDAVGAMVDATIIYNDTNPTLTRAAITGDVSVGASSNIATLSTVNSNIGTFGSATAVAQVTVSSKGLVTAASTVTIAIPSTQVTDFTEASQDAVGAMVDTTIVYNDAGPLLTRAAITGDVAIAASSNTATLSTVNANIGTFGSSTRVASVTVSSKGLVTAVSSIAIAIPSGSVTDFTEAAQDAVGAMVDSTLVYTDATPFLGRASITGDVSVPVSSNTATLSSVNSNIGTFGSSTAVAQITVSSKGLVTAVSSVAIVYDSANFTGTDWDDLTDGGDTTLHVHDIYYEVDGSVPATGDHDFSGATSFKIPVSTVPTLDANGKIALDTLVTSWVHGLVAYRSSSTYAMMAMPFGNVTSVAHGNLVAYTSSAAGLNFVSPTSATTVTVADEATDTSCFINFTTAATGDLGIKSNANLTFNSNTGVFTSASAVLTTADINGGTLDGVTIGGASAAAASFTTASASGQITSTVSTGTAPMVIASTTKVDNLHVARATVGDTVTIAAAPADTTCFPLVATAATGSLEPKTSSQLTYNAVTGLLHATQFEIGSGNNAIFPEANDQASLGTTSLGFSDLFLAEGAVINWDNGDATLTQTGNVLSLESAAFMIGDTANANNTAGLTVNQGAADDHAFTGKSSDVATGLTTIVNRSDVETDDFFVIEKLNVDGGGLSVKALTESTNAIHYRLESYGGAPVTTDTTASTGALNFVAAQHDGANALVDMAADSNLAVWREIDSGGSSLTRMLLKADDGELHLGNTTLVALDDEDDRQLVRAMQIASASSGIRLTPYDNPFYNYDRLRDLGLAGPKDESGFFLFPLQTRLHAHEGAMWQTHVEVQEEKAFVRSEFNRMASEILALHARVAQLEARMIHSEWTDDVGINFYGHYEVD